MNYITLEDAVSSLKEKDKTISINKLLSKAAAGEIEIFAYFQLTATYPDKPISTDAYGVAARKMYGIHTPSHISAGIRQYCRLDRDAAQDLAGQGKTIVRRAFTSNGEQITFEKQELDESRIFILENARSNNTDNEHRLERMVNWRRAIVLQWTKIASAHAEYPTAREVIAWLKANDQEGDIKNTGSSDELVWLTARGQAKPVTLHTVETALWHLAKKGLIPPRPEKS